MNHERVTGHPPPRAGTQAQRAVLSSFKARRKEGISLADLKLASLGAWSDEFRRENGYTSIESVLRPTKVAGLVEKGRAAMAAEAGREERRSVYDRVAN